MNRKIFLVIAGMFFTGSISAQYAEDALRFSRTFPGGTARIMGMAGAQNALGADISSLVGNPAGLGFYRSSDFSISPTLRFNTTESKAFGNLSSEKRDQLNIGSLGFTVTQLNQDYSGADVQNGWVSYTFGFGMNRTNSFFENRYFSGTNSNSAIGNYFAEIANGRDASAFPDTNVTSLEDMAWYGYVIDFDTVSNSFIRVGNGSVRQTQADQIEGSQNEWTFAFGANYSNTLYLGASIGLGTVRYERVSKFTESDINDPLYNLQNVTLNDRLTVDGSSFNIKIGAIVRPTDFVRVGLSMQTPDYYNLDESYVTDLSSVANPTGNAVENFRYNSLEYLFQYKLRTPFRYNAGLAFIFNKLGLISADVELVDYSNNRLSAGGDFADFGPEQNGVIQNLYKSAYNVRIGAEGKLGPFSIRGGYARYGDPTTSTKIDLSRNILSGGIGYRQSDYYFDLAFVNQQHKNIYSPYFLNNGSEPQIENTVNTNSVILTVGTRF